MRESPKFLNLFKIYLPLTGFVSILHRVTGVLNIFLFVGLLYLYWLLPQGNEIDLFLEMRSVQFLFWIAISALLYHFLAGVRHMYMDFSHVHRLRFAKNSGWAVLVISVLLIGWVGAKLWIL